MALNLDVHRLPAGATLTALLPFIPGGALVFGGLLLHPEWVGRLPPSQIERDFLIAFAAYCLGLTSVLCSDAVAILISTLMLLLVRFTQRQTKSEEQETDKRSKPWTDPVIRALMRELIPTSLNLPPPEPEDPSSLMEVIKAVKESPSLSPESFRALLRKSERESERLEEQWQTWYSILAKLLASEMGFTRASLYLFSTLQAFGSVGLLVIWQANLHSVLLIIAAASVGAIGLLYVTQHRLLVLTNHIGAGSGMLAMIISLTGRSSAS